jgi:acetoacetyl-CoA synthetase
VLEGFSQVVLDAICVGQRRPNKDDDERVLLFVQLVDGAKLSDTLKRDISQAIRKAYSPRHVPAHIFQVDGIPCVAAGR